ncbi:MAG: hypothetical protein JAY97_15570, partial [Candidatus Thiodiazotropha sp. 'RUGA']|nr:hypothetical protein [Candidatus Thiodiazotropha sp. 'RUGA']
MSWKKKYDPKIVLNQLKQGCFSSFQYFFPFLTPLAIAKIVLPVPYLRRLGWQWYKSVGISTGEY